MNKTGQYWLGKMPAKMRPIILLRMYQQKRESVLLEQFDDKYDFIVNAFSWLGTPETRLFWREFALSLREK